jgi:phage/plasmid-associated DNA primase
MLGENVSAIEPGDMFERFQLHGLHGKLVNMCTDISTETVISQRFKDIVTGGFVTCDIKHKKAIRFRPVAKHLFSANSLIITKDRSYGFFRRFDVLEFTKIFDENTRDERLKEKIATEIPGIFNWSLAGLQRLKDQKWKFTYSDEFAENHKTFQRESNPVAMFIEEQFTELTLEILEKRQVPIADWASYIYQYSITCANFREFYVQWCKDNGYKPLAERQLGREVIRLGFEKKRIRNLTGKRFYVYYGLSYSGDEN